MRRTTQAGMMKVAGGGTAFGYNPAAALGDALVMYLDAEEIAGADGDPINTAPNLGTEADFSQATAASRPTLRIVGGKKAVEHDGINDHLLANASMPSIADWTFYAVAKNSTTSPAYFLRTQASGNESIISGFVANKWEYFGPSPRTQIADISTTTYQVIKCTVGTTGSGTWRLGGNAAAEDWGGSWRVVIAVNRALTAGEEADLEAWLAARI